MLEQWKSRWGGRLAAVLLGRGGVAIVQEGAEESAPFAKRPEPAAIRHVWGGAGNGGLAAGCPRLKEPSPSARRRRSVRPSTKDVQYHRMAPRCVYIFFFSRLCLSSSFRLLFSRLDCPYPQAAVIGSPQRGGEGGSRAQSREYPPACEGRWGYVTSGML